MSPDNEPNDEHLAPRPSRWHPFQKATLRASPATEGSVTEEAIKTPRSTTSE